MQPGIGVYFLRRDREWAIREKESEAIRREHHPYSSSPKRRRRVIAHEVAIGQTNVGQCKAWVFLNRLLKATDRLGPSVYRVD